MRILVTGGRDYDRPSAVAKVLNTLTITELCQGGARGADFWAKNWCEIHGIPVTTYPADWSLGRKAGVLRNQQMLEEFKPDLVVAFPGGRGTADMVARAKAAGVEVREVQ